MAAANATMVSKHPSTIMVEAPATVNKKQEMEAKHDLELERIRHECELQQLQKVGNNEFNVFNINAIIVLSILTMRNNKQMKFRDNIQ